MSEQKKTSKKMGGSPSSKGQALRSQRNKRLAIERDANLKMLAEHKKHTRGQARALRRSKGEMSTAERRAQARREIALQQAMFQKVTWVGSIASGHYVFGDGK